MGAWPPHAVLRFSFGSCELQGNRVDETEAYKAFCSHLKPLSGLLATSEKIHSSSSVGEFGHIERVSASRVRYCHSFQSWHTSCAKVEVGESQVVMVYKGLSFFDYLSYGGERFIHFVEAIYNDIRHIHGIITSHPHFMPPAASFVTAVEEGGSTTSSRILGCLYPLYQTGSLADVIDRSVSNGQRIPLWRKAEWCRQFASAMIHLHKRAGSWHQDITPNNTLVDDAGNLLLIDFEQVGAGRAFLAPEAYGQFEAYDDESHQTDASQGDDGNANTSSTEKPRVRYIPYDGPPRINNYLSHPEWIVFEDWKARCPRAVELAEVWGMGKWLFFLLQEV